MSGSPLRHRGNTAPPRPRVQARPLALALDAPEKDKPRRLPTLRERVRALLAHRCVAIPAYAAAVAAAFRGGIALGRRAAAPDYDVAIVGAGWAGLAAARTLLDAGVTSVLVLEANGHVGGRARSVNGPRWAVNAPGAVGDADNLPTEMGCEWLYVGTAMGEALHERKLLTEPMFANNGSKMYSIDFLSAAYYNQTLTDGKVQTSLVQNITSHRERVWRGFSAERSLANHTAYTAPSYAAQLREYKRRHNLSTHDERFLDLLESIVEVESTGDSEDVSSWQSIPLVGHTHYTSIPGMGFGNVAGAFAAPFASLIRLNASVVQLEKSSEAGHIRNLVTYVRDGVNETVSAETVIVTVPLGVLKVGTIRFVPRLPAWKTDLFADMGFGLLNKCIMYWDHPEDVVWPKDTFWLELITADSATSDQWTTFFNPTSFKKVPVLVGFIAGQAAVDAEAQTDEEILRRVMRNLKSMFPSIRAPDRVLVTRWGRDATARGSYAFKRAHRNWDEDSTRLRRRIGKLWFAGEATHSSPGTTYAAWDTGAAAAEEVALYLRWRRLWGW